MMASPFNQAPASVLTETIEWPNGKGFTPCSAAYRAALDEQARIKPEGVSMDSLSAEDYQRWNELDHQLMTMQASGEHLGQSISSEKGAFDDLPEDDLDAVLNSPMKAASDIKEMPNPAARFEEPCRKCRGSGRFISWAGRDCGACRQCKGTGKLTFKTSKEDRAKGRSQSVNAKAKKAASNLEAFKIEYPAIFAWMDGSTFDFAIKMKEAVEKYGHLTERQLAACSSCIMKLEAKKAEAVARVQNAKEIDTAKIEAAFAMASSKLKSPKLRVAGLVISHAKATSANAGALYVKSATVQNDEGRGLYLGKIMGGKFIRSRECDDAAEASLLDVANDPKEAAIKYGRVTGCCACCGRPLENKESIARGIGPVCAEKFGW